MTHNRSGNETGGEQFQTTRHGRWWTRLPTAIVMALLIGLIAAWAFSNIGGSAIVFVIAALGSGFYLYKKPLPSAAIGTGLYLTAGLLVLTPILIYVPDILATEGAESAEEAGTFIGSILGLLIWGFVYFLIGLVLFGLGYFSNKRAKKKLEARETPVS